MKRRRFFLQSLSAAAAVSATSPVAANKRAARQMANYFPNVVLQTQDGKKVRFYDDLLKGKIVIINAMYTVCSGTCPSNTASLKNVQEALSERVGRDIFIYSISLQPEQDSPAALHDYAKKYGAGQGWTFLTGKRDDIELIRRKLGFYDSDPIADANIANHAGILRVGNEARERWFMMPAAAPTKQIVKAILNIT